MANENKTPRSTQEKKGIGRNKQKMNGEKKATANKRAMQIYFKTIYFVLSEYLHWFRFRERVNVNEHAVHVHLRGTIL